MKIVVIASHPGSLTTFRGEMLKAMRSGGHEVVTVAPGEKESVTAILAELGVRYVSVAMTRTGLDPIEDLRTCRALHRLLSEARADVVLAYTAKPVIYGLLAARLARVPLRVAMISGRGSALAGGEGLKRRALAKLMSTLYAVALRGAHVVFFQNPDDEALFRSSGMVGRGQRRVLINGSGVDLDHYAPAPLPDGPVTFLMIGRLLRDKGFFEYIEAARAVKDVRPNAQFQLLGGVDPNPISVGADPLGELQRDGSVEYLGFADDVRPVIAGAHVIVLPSYQEGMPRSVLEGMSMGRAIITTDAPGCRETVEPGRNGLLVPVRNANALAAAMLDLFDDRQRVSEMGMQSRQMAEERYDVHAVNRVILEAMGL
jgi:glycosyltransferase involved in cell wall biosynthesis